MTRGTSDYATRCIASGGVLNMRIQTFSPGLEMEQDRSPQRTSGNPVARWYRSGICWRPG